MLKVQEVILVNRISIKKFIKNLFFRYIDDEVTAMSSQLAYSLLLSFFPFLILLFTLIGYSPMKSTDVLVLLKNLLPNEVFKLVRNTVIEVVDTKRFGLLSFGMISTIWTASNGFNAVIRGLNMAYDEEEKRPYWKVQMIAILSTIGLIFIILTALALIVFGELGFKILAKHSNPIKSLELIIDICRYIIGIFIMLITITIVYRFTPSKKLRIKEIIPGAIFTSLGWTIASLLFSYYVNNFGNYSMIYGSLGAVIALMTWLFISSVIIMLGGEVNATIAYIKAGKEKPKGTKY
jgi:membrane protein